MWMIIGVDQIRTQLILYLHCFQRGYGTNVHGAFCRLNGVYMGYGRCSKLSNTYTFTILATVELRFTSSYQIVIHRHDS